GRGTPDAQTRIHRLECARGVVVERPVRGLSRLAPPEIQIWLVPHLEVPAAHLADSVALDEVAREGADQRIPSPVVLRRRDHRSVPEALPDVRAGELPRHETELYERAHAVGEKAVVYLIDVGEVVDGLTLGILRVHADLVVEDGVKTHVSDRRHGAHGAQVLAIALAEG